MENKSLSFVTLRAGSGRTVRPRSKSSEDFFHLETRLEHFVYDFSWGSRKEAVT